MPLTSLLLVAALGTGGALASGSVIEGRVSPEVVGDGADEDTGGEIDDAAPRDEDADAGEGDAEADAEDGADDADDAEGESDEAEGEVDDAAAVDEAETAEHAAAASTSTASVGGDASPSDAEEASDASAATEGSAPRDEDLDDRVARPARRPNRERPDEGEWRVFAPYPELGTIRYRDPELRRTLWLGADVSGIVLPQSLGLFNRTVWTVRPAGSWALALTPWLAVGGRHSVAWYDADNIRVRLHAHQVELSSRPLATARPDMALDDRLSLGLSHHAVRNTEVDGVSLAPGGLRDTILQLGYGLDHLLGVRWRLGWQVQGRYVWVYRDTQRQVRGSARLAFHPRPPHRLWVEAVGFYVHRDERQAGNLLPRHSGYGQFGLGYAWMSQAGVGPWVQGRFNTGFLSGEAPVYEIREEALNTNYGEVLVGLLARWP